MITDAAERRPGRSRDADGPDASDAAREQTRDIVCSRGFRRLARFGLASRAAVYAVFGALVLLLAVGHPAGNTAPEGALQQLEQTTGGFVVVLLLAIGFAAYALWRFAEAAFGVVAEGKGAGPRLRALAGALTYSAFTAMAVHVMLPGPSGSPRQEQSLSARVMRHTGGRWAVGIVGAVIVITSLWQVRDGLTRGFAKYFDRAAMRARSWRATEILGVIGTTARGVVFTVAGGFVVTAAIRFDPHDARGLDGSLRQVRDTTAGPYVLGVLGVGLLAFAAFGVCEVRWRRTGTADQSRSSVS